MNSEEIKTEIKKHRNLMIQWKAEIRITEKKLERTIRMAKYHSVKVSSLSDDLRKSIQEEGKNE